MLYIYLMYFYEAGFVNVSMLHRIYELSGELN